MDHSLNIPKKYEFATIEGFRDYFAHVVCLDADDFIPEDFVPAELQWTLDEVFHGLELGYRLVTQERGDLPVLADCRRLTSEARKLYDEGNYDEGRDRLSTAELLIESLAS